MQLEILILSLEQRFPVIVASDQRIKNIFFIYGYIEYTDIYHRIWRTTFASIHMGGSHFIPDPNHNNETKVGWSFRELNPFASHPHDTI